MKRSTTIRVTEDARRLMAVLAKKKGISQSAVLELAIRDMAKREQVQNLPKERP